MTRYKIPHIRKKYVLSRARFVKNSFPQATKWRKTRRNPYTDGKGERVGDNK